MPQSELPEQPNSSDHRISFKSKVADEASVAGNDTWEQLAEHSIWHIWHSTIRCKKTSSGVFCVLPVLLRTGSFGVFLHKFYSRNSTHESVEKSQETMRKPFAILADFFADGSILA